ncbi:unnamed protein product, partial [Ectocarpus sp. 12 AP-2014]
ASFAHQPLATASFPPRQYGNGRARHERNDGVAAFGGRPACRGEGGLDGGRPNRCLSAAARGYQAGARQPQGVAGPRRLPRDRQRQQAAGRGPVQVRRHRGEQGELRPLPP